MEIPIISRSYSLTILVDDGFNPLKYGRLGIVWNRGQKYPYVICADSKLLHRKIINAPDGLLVDHINKNTLDNRRENLRIVSYAQNTWNRKVQQGKSPNTSGYRGVTAIPCGKFVAVISHNCKTINLGRFRTAVEAAIAYDKKALELRGEFAVLNFPPPAADPLASSSVQVHEGY